MKLFGLRKTFAHRVSFWVLITTMVVLGLTFGIGLWFASERMLAEGHDKANLELDKAIAFIDDELSDVEVAGRNFAYFWPKDKKLNKEQIFDRFRQLLNCNPNIQGVAFCLDPNECRESPTGFAPYLSKINGVIKENMLNERYSYSNREWYKTTKETDKANWSNPFREINGTIISSYCIPLHNSKGKFIGVMAIDISLNTLTEKLQTIKPYPSSIVMLLDRNFRFIVHPKTEYILKETAMSLVKRANYHPNESIYIDMKNRKRGFGMFHNGKQNEYLYYAPIKQADWTITIETNEPEILKGVTMIRREMIINSLLGLIGIWVALFIIVSRLLRPINHFAKLANNIANGDFHTHLPKLKHKDELWQLGQALNLMQQSLNKYINDLKVTTEAKGRIESELKIASSIQMAMIPKIFPPYPERDDVKLYGMLHPAKEVGGDLYDFFIRENKLIFCVGDVSGKGIPASLVMAVTRSLVRIVANKEDNPARIVTALNDSMSDMNDSNMFVTMFVGVLNLSTGLLQYCNAGHNAPVIINSQDEKVEMLPVEANIPVAILPNMMFKMQEVQLASDDTIFIYTDGLTEAENKEKNLFGDDRMLEALKATQNLHPTEIVKNMNREVKKYTNGAEQSDDLTMLCIKCEFKATDNCLAKKEAHVRSAVFHNNIKDVPTLGEFIDGIAEEEHIDELITNSINLALEEAVVNVMNYAYPEGIVGKIELESHVTADEWKFVITDYGKAFDPTKVEDADVTLDVEDRPIGGLGIFLVKQIMDTISYVRKENKNVLTLTKKLNNTSI